MKHLIIGAGASVAEAIDLGLPEEMHPPVIGNFARKTWADYSPSPLLNSYLKEKGITELREEAEEIFYKLEAEGKANIEEFMEFLWKHRETNFSFSLVNTTINSYRNFLHHGIGSAISLILINGFFENGKGFKTLKASAAMNSCLEPQDLVLNLNYDTLFEIGMRQTGKMICYSPKIPKENEFLICKPHGSLNLIEDETKATFGDPESIGMIAPSSSYNFYFLPPCLNKSYDRHPLSKTILTPVIGRKPSRIIMWGIGLTESDRDLVEIYKSWAKTVKTIEVINPSSSAAEKISNVLEKPIQHFLSHKEWLTQQ